MRPKFNQITQMMLLCLVIGLVYSPTFKAEPCLLDDVAMLKGLQSDTQFDLKGIIPINSEQFGYYRPLIGISYWCAKSLWGASSQAMHIENVVFHLINVVLIFWLIKFSLRDNSLSNRYIPLLGSLLFALHPITTESVNWISGRTDLIAGGCIISAAISLIAWQQKRSRWWLILLALLCLVGAVMTKEISWGFMAVLPFFLVAPYDSRTFTLSGFIGQFSRLEKLLFLTAIALCFFLAIFILSFWPVIVLSTIIGLVVWYRKPRRQPLTKKNFVLVSGLIIFLVTLTSYFLKLAQQSASGFYSNFSRTVLLITLDVDNSIAIFSAALAFYIKKFFLPIPLSFAITDIAPWYMFIGIALIILTAFLTAWRSQAAILFLTGIALLLLTLPLAHGQIAWTPYAERYIYISSGFWVASMAVALSSLKSPPIRTSCAIFCLVIISMAALITYKRSVVWQTNLSLFEDTVLKSPRHLDARLMYMTELCQAGRLLEALQQYRSIQADPRKRMKYINDLALLLYNAGLKQEAWEVLDTSLAKPLPPGEKHPLNTNEWQRLYKFHSSLRQELLPQ